MSTIDEKLTLANENVPKVYAAGGAGTDLSNYVKKTDYASATTAGVVKVPVDSGIELETDGGLCVKAASDSEIAARTESCRPIVPSNLNNAVKAALIDKNRINDMTSEEMSIARGVISAVGFDDFLDGYGEIGGIVRIQNAGSGIEVTNGYLQLTVAYNSEIDARTDTRLPITIGNLDYAVRSVRPSVVTALPAALSVNTIYALDYVYPSLSLVLPSGEHGDFIQVDFSSGATPTNLTITSSTGLSDIDLTPEANTTYSLYFDYGIIHADDDNNLFYGWRFGYSEYPYEEV